MRLAGTPSHPSYPLHQNAGSTSVPNRRSDSIASACVMLPKFMLSRSSSTPMSLESGSGGDGKHFVVRADEKLTAFLELESAIRRFK